MTERRKETLLERKEKVVAEPGTGQASSAVPGRQPKLYGGTLGRLGALCHRESCRSPPVRSQ